MDAPGTSVGPEESEAKRKEIAMRQLLEAVDVMEKPLQTMAKLDVVYQSNMREVERLQNILKESNLADLTHEIVDDIYDCIEYELRMAQHITSWKTAVMYEADVKLQNLIGQQNEPQQSKQQVPKAKAPRARRPAITIKEGIRRPDKDSQHAAMKGKGKESYPTVTTTSEQNQMGRQKRPILSESSEGKAQVQKKRGAGRPRLPRKPRQSAAVVTIATEDGNSAEQIYCICRQISYGEMVCCDNRRCNEWFHFQCVDVKIKPKGDWFCPKCRGDRSDVINPALVG